MSTRRRLAVSLVAAAAAAGAVPLFVSSGTSSAAPAPAQCPSTPSYDYTIPTPVGPPAAISLDDAEFADAAYVALGADKKLYYVESFIDSDPLAVSPLSCLGGQATDVPAVAVGPDGTRAFFVRTSTGVLYQRYVGLGDNYSSIGAFTKVNNAASSDGPAAIVTPDGQYHLFVRGTNGALYHGYKQTDSDTSWRFESLGGQIVGAPTAIVDGNRVLVAAVGTNGSVYTIAGTNLAWGPFIKIVNKVQGNPTAQVTTKSRPSLVKDPESGVITMYAASSSYGLFAIAKNSGAGFNGALWFRLDTVLPSDARIAAATNGGDTIVYARFLDRPSGQTITAYTQYLTSTGTWSDYFLAPYTCYNCAPYGVDVAAKSKSTDRSLASAKLSPGKGQVRQMPATRKVLG